MKVALWQVPLSITLQNGMPRRFCGPYEALDFLENEWPNHGKWYHRATRDCRAALSGILSAEVARDSFVAACGEASLGCSDVQTGFAFESANAVFRRHH
ncbi:DUF982 domain-containing protein [Sinorhizobium meliloti]|uniref:DUF982 domain-containing protein n=1 Tax=Rhizobium meliloti TaxID=382 RepID=UPI000FD93EA0|nr:DUF982 domain-containing protein [Sinorhizobium meliloti]MQX40877.1 DUF982 domain-containing protein [Sinorhizobium meliloti]RVP11834.1 DUF982 domain-containing protein [Sinorhizobium meliloti]